MSNHSRIVTPGPGRPRWVAPSTRSELVYLSWGSRDFSKSPIPEHHNPGWSYVVICSGTVRISQGPKERSLGSSECLLAGPGCSYGLRHAKGERCELLVWIFRSAPNHSPLGLGTDLFQTVTLDTETRRFVENLHAQTREEISRVRDFFEPSVIHIRELLDIQIMRSLHGPRKESVQDRRLTLAYDWMLNNLELNDPVRSLCDYLQISQSTLHRLFRDHYSMAPGAVHRRLRVQEAQRLIEEEGWQVKQAAYRLGYHHANDLSRALSRAVADETTSN
ncbi:transcriptional activator FtrA [Planctomycetes bacterium CA13]|uniref:Transcriptional activator FtrA n=1 Tax=Novipirellula herctigrandis TaxID=2527986 RepID=A0A5C5Z1G6_9BACT|nr:transcriptional activator FtrA [Planctomycetes bacterium CA13]